MFSSNLLDFISVLRICSTAFNFDLLEGVKLRARFLYKPSLLDQSEHGMSCCRSNILSSLILILFAVFSSASFFYGFIFFSPHLQSIKRKDDPQEVKVQMQFMVYGTRPSKDKSGAYLFLPDGKAKVLLSLSQRLYVRCLLASQEALIESLLCIVSLYHAGVLGAGRQADWVLLHLLIDFLF